MQLLDLGVDHQPAIGLVAVQPVVILVVPLGRVKVPERNDLCNDRLRPERFGPGSGALRHLPLALVVAEDGRAVLAPHVCPLAVPGGRVVASPEHLEEFLEGDNPRVEGDLHRLRMAGRAAAHLLICGVGHLPSGIT